MEEAGVGWRRRKGRQSRQRRKEVWRLDCNPGLRLVRKMSFLREVLVRSRLMWSQWASTRNCHLAYNRVCFSEYLYNKDNFCHSKDFGYNQTFWFSCSWRRSFLKSTSDLISVVCKKAAVYWQKGLQSHLVRLILFLHNKKISIGALFPCLWHCWKRWKFCRSVSSKVPEF